MHRFGAHIHKMNAVQFKMPRMDNWLMISVSGNNSVGLMQNG